MEIMFTLLNFIFFNLKKQQLLHSFIKTKQKIFYNFG